MRSVQRGISAFFLVIAILAITVAIAAGYFTFYFDLKKTKQLSVNSFEDCAKSYPVMESYPEQCNTPDGKHFVRQLASTEPSVSDPEITVQNFYKWSVNCYEETIGKRPLEECSSEKSEYSQGKLNNPFCAQNIPIKVKTDKVILNGDKAHVIAYTQWETSAPGPINVELVKLGNKWEITNISCP